MVKVIKLFKLLKDVQAPAEKARAEQLFRKYSDIDIAATLRLHFANFKPKQPNMVHTHNIYKLSTYYGLTF
jgi:hypothetical protein